MIIFTGHKQIQTLFTELKNIVSFTGVCENKRVRHKNVQN